MRGQRESREKKQPSAAVLQYLPVWLELFENILSGSTFVKAFFESVINYGFVVWGNTSLATLSKLQVAQKWIIKIMLFKLKRYSSELVFRDSKILNLEQLYLKSLIRFMMKYDFYKEYLQHGQNTRSAAQAKVKLQNPRHTACQSHVYCIGPKVYNDVPNSIKRLRYSTVKKELTRWIIDSQYAINYVI
ncbi:unnamed protein product [Acanthoscelides obtectus]|uniref:Uncharacterized protein n=1 Tax=Acanthoscelides obtectus TaxID=200917 RepID=A0A9P0LE66_ACAOB|nr:unnamed protein product [Acanthoscelides obtectus]CAK1684189.1 hypothetical protein AOBTE_LOCUS34696 [Acanthoscelides obtectus]